MAISALRDWTAGPSALGDVGPDDGADLGGSGAAPLAALVVADVFSFKPATGAGDAAPAGFGAWGGLLDGQRPMPVLVAPVDAPDAVDGAAVQGTAAAAPLAAPPAVEPVPELFDSYTSGRGTLGIVSGFNITVVFEGDDWTPELQEEFVLAAEYLSTLITGDVRNFRGVDDIVITASLEDIDGVNGILGQAGPTMVRPKGLLPSKGVMEFDTADAEALDADGLFDDTVIHEMMHCLGMGTVWDFKKLTTGSVRGDDMRFTGLNAEVAYKTNYPALYAADPDAKDGVPIETDGGPGTAGGHWDDDTFGNELFTGYIDDENYVGAITVAALEDMGYRTVFDILDPAAAIPQPGDFLIGV